MGRAIKIWPLLKFWAQALRNLQRLSPISQVWAFLGFGLFYKSRTPGHARAGLRPRPLRPWDPSLLENIFDQKTQKSCMAYSIFIFIFTKMIIIHIRNFFQCFTSSQEQKVLQVQKASSSEFLKRKKGFLLWQ